jgi:hypothetical protein
MGIPQLHRLLVAGRGQAFPVRAECHAKDIAIVPLQREEFLATRGIPYLRHLIPASRRQSLLVQLNVAQTVLCPPSAFCRLGVLYFTVLSSLAEANCFLSK